MSPQEHFESYIQEHFPDRSAEVCNQFRLYHAWLTDINQQINLISRKTTPEEYWTLHFLDSVLLTEVTRFTTERVLDFGTGGGLPGVPLAILYPEAEFHLLDARKKKLEVIADACELLQLDNVELIHGRVEEIDFHFANSFDAIVSRSVKISKEFKKSLLTMVTHGGKLYFYKSIQLEDVEQFKKHTKTDVSTPEIGTRTIVTAWK